MQKWLAANGSVSGHPLLAALYKQLEEILHDGHVDEDEKVDLLDTFNRDFELGETMKASTLPL